MSTTKKWDAEESKSIFNCHTHIFTIDHVPDKFGKTLLPFPNLITIRLVKYYFENYTIRGSKRFKTSVYKIRKLYYNFTSFLKDTVILWWLYLICLRIVKWLLNKIVKFINLDRFFTTEFKALLNRFYTMGRYSIHYKTQGSIYNFLKKNYPEQTRFIVLTMDMEYMAAGKPKISFLEQLDEVIALKKKKQDLYPFIFVDPRRIEATSSANSLKNYSSFCKSVLSKGLFSGIKIYPALGYYPFDSNLIEMYEFAVKNNIPVMTHCVRGIVFYRGSKKEEWGKHPILKYNKGNNNLQNIPLPQKSNIDFTANFTHPLNYHCLLDKQLLNSYLKENGIDREVDLSKLKICLAHFGGIAEWEKYKQDAWNNYNNNIPPYLKSQRKNTLTHGSKRTVWWNASWLSVIYDLILTYENVYADVSFILYEEEMFPTLKYLLLNPKIKRRLLFGTDFYVVSQKGVDKVLYHKLRSYLGEEDFMQIAHTNAREYLSTTSYSVI